MSRLTRRWASAAPVLLVAALACGPAEAEAESYHFLDVRVTATGDVLGAFTVRQNEGSATTTTTGASSSALSVGVNIVHSWVWLPTYGGVTLVGRIAFDQIKGAFLAPGETLYAPNLALGLGYVQPVNRYFQIELVPFFGVGAGSLSYTDGDHSGLATKAGFRGNFVFTIGDTFQVQGTAGYSWSSFSFPDLGASGTTIAAHGASAGGGLGASF